jgi:hypothetical protein
METDISWEWGLKTRLPLLALKAFNKGLESEYLNRRMKYRFLSANVGTSTSVNVDIKVIATATCVLSNQPGIISLRSTSVNMKNYFLPHEWQLANSRLQDKTRHECRCRQHVHP